MKIISTIFLLLLINTNNGLSQRCWNDFTLKSCYQETEIWCGAAAIEMVMEFHYPYDNFRQCNIVSDIFNVNSCSIPYMNRNGIDIRDMRSYLYDNSYGVEFDSSIRKGALSVREIADNILNCQPIIALINPSPFSQVGHFVVIVGIWESGRDYYGNTRYQVMIKDPYPYNWNSIVTKGISGVDYNDFRRIWTASITDIYPE